MIFCNRIYVDKAQRVPPFTFFGTMRHFLKEKKSKISSFFLKKSLSRILSLRYSADFRRSRLVFKASGTLGFLQPILYKTRRPRFFNLQNESVFNASLAVKKSTGYTIQSMLKV